MLVLYKKERKHFFANLDIKSFLDNKKFWKNVKPFFSDKSFSTQKISLIDQNNVISDEKKVAEHFHNFFEKAVSSLDLYTNSDLLGNVIINQIDSSIDIIISKFRYHPSVLKINASIWKI